MSISLNNAIRTADELAGKAWAICAGPRAFRWRDGLHYSSAGALAQFVAARRQATAADLYAFAVADDAKAATWEQIPPALRVAVEVFRATMAVLLNESEREPVVRLTSVPRVEPVQLDIESEIDIASQAERDWSRDTGRPARKGGRA